MKALRFLCKKKKYVAFGVRLGYWPCLQAPFLQVNFWTWRAEVWYGYESYKVEDLHYA